MPDSNRWLVTAPLASTDWRARPPEGRGRFLLGWVLGAGSVTGGATVGVKE